MNSETTVDHKEGKHSCAATNALYHRDIQKLELRMDER